MSFHITPHAEAFAATRIGACVRFLPGMGVRMDLQRARSRERLAARRA